MIDFSPIAAFFALKLLGTLIIRLLHSVGIY
jgi:YggT family protein